MSSTRYTDEFKQEAIRQVIERGHSVAEVAGRLGTTTHSLYAWIKRFNGPTPQEALDQAAEPAGITVDIEALHAQTERQFERVWKTIEFNPALSQAPLPEELPEQAPQPAKPRHKFPDQQESLGV